MNQLESMSSGGLGIRLEYQLKIGVSNDLEDFSLLGSAEIHRIVLYQCQNLIDLKAEMHFRTKQPVEVYSSKKFKNGGYIDIKQPDRCKEDCERCYVDTDVCEWIEYNQEPWLWDYIRLMAVTRFFEIWGDRPRNREKIFIGLGAGETRKASVNGIIGRLNQLGAIEKNENDDWMLKNDGVTKIPNRKFIPLKNSAILQCREVAKKYSNC